MTWDALTPEEREAVLRLVRAEIDHTRYPLSPEIRLLRGALDKLDPPPAKPAPLPPMKPAGEPSWAMRKGKRRR